MSSRRIAPGCRSTSTRSWTPPTAVWPRFRVTTCKTAVDEAYMAFGGLGPELSRLVDGGTALAIDARANLDPLTTLIDQSKPILDSQTDSGGAIQAWASNLAIDHRSAAGAGRCGGRHPGEGAGRGRRGAGPVRPVAAHAADRVGQSGEHRRGRRRLSAEPRAAAGVVARRAPRRLRRSASPRRTPSRTTWATT